MTEEILIKWLDKTKDDLIKNYDRLGLRASGNWAKQLETYIEKKGFSFIIGILGEQYTGAIEYGRRPNLKQDNESIRRFVGWAGSTFIEQWVKDKGLDLNPYAVAYKIANHGWKVPNPYNKGGLLSDVLDKNVEDLKKQLYNAQIEDIKTQVQNTLG